MLLQEAEWRLMSVPVFQELQGLVGKQSECGKMYAQE